MEKQKLLVIAGPTASGKSSLAIRMAKRWNGEVISADSMQVYRRMDIGTAKVTPEEAEGIPHHLIDVLEPTEEWNVALFQEQAEAAIRDIASRGRLPILCGGTGFYLHALLYGTQFAEEPEQRDIRKELEDRMRTEGPEKMHEALRAVDPEAADSIHPHNEKRVIRALEYYRIHGTPISQHNREMRQKPSPYDLCFLALDMDRTVLYDRIDRRVDLMIEQGLVDEVRGLVQEGLSAGMTAMQGLGYKEILPYLEGSCTLEEAVRVLKRDTRHFAKRQLTWLRAEKDVRWIDAGHGAEELLRQAEEQIRQVYGK